MYKRQHYIRVDFLEQVVLGEIRRLTKFVSQYETQFAKLMMEMCIRDRQLEAAVDTAYQEMRQTSGELKALETKLQGKKKLQRQVLAYAQTKAARDGLRAQKSEKARAAYRQAHESDFIIADAAPRYFKAHGITNLPARKALQAEIEQLISEKDGLYNTYHEQKQRFKELQTVKRNIDQILRREEPHRRKEQSHER